MGATSVTGVGNGAANLVRGPGNGRNSFVSTLDPHVVFSGTVAADGGTKTIYIPSDVKDLPENLTLLVAGKGYAVAKNLDGDGLVESFDVFGAKKQDIDFLVVKNPSSLFTSGF